MPQPQTPADEPPIETGATEDGGKKQGIIILYVVDTETARSSFSLLVIV